MAEVSTVPFEKCKKLYEGDGEIVGGMFCAGHQEGGKDACQVHVHIF